MGEFINLRDKCEKAGVMDRINSTLLRMGIDADSAMIGIFCNPRIAPYIMAVINNGGKEIVVSTGVKIEETC